jgi:hypothetical protein
VDDPLAMVPLVSSASVWVWVEVYVLVAVVVRVEDSEPV